MTSFTPILSAEQLDALSKVQSWLDSGPSRKRFFKIFGGAGTGKTTIARHMADGSPGNVVFGAYTGKAALNMVKAGCKDAATLHSLLHRPDKRGGRVRYVFNPKGRASKADLLIVDECSMIDHGLAGDLLKLRKPVLLLGDPMQLPPPHDGDSPFDKNPDVTLRKVHRQGEGSAILDYATAIRDGTEWAPTPACDVTFIYTEEELQDAVFAVDQIIAGENGTISRFNEAIRHKKGFAGLLPQPGERLVSYRNGPGPSILNGEQFKVVGRARPGRDPDTCTLDICSLDRTGANTVTVDVLLAALTDGPDDRQLDWCAKRQIAAMRYAYAITAHKAQGSQWDSVLVFDESRSFPKFPRKWLYTAVTRAAKRLIVFRP